MSEFCVKQLADWGDTLAAVLAHSLWQGLLVSLAVLIVLRTVPARHASLRYLASVGGLVAVVLASFVTWAVLRLPDERASVAVLPDQPVAVGQLVEATDHGESARTPASAAASRGDNAGRKARGKPLSTWPGQRRRLTASVVVCWLVGVLVMLARMVSVFARSRHWLKGDSELLACDLSTLEGLVAELSERLGLRRVARLVVSDRVSVPAVLGMLWPVILIPPAMVTGISMEQWRIVLAHELAHVRRYDNLVNLAQMVIESLLFFNPAVWWISRQIRAEREASCDALAAEVAGQPMSVARALIDVADSLRAGPVVAASPAVTALTEPGDAGSLTDRVCRLLQPNVASRPRLTWAGLLLALLVVVAAGAALQQGTDLAVRKVAALMSPKERVATLARLQAEKSGVFVQPGTSEEGVEPAEDALALDGGTQKITVTVRIRTEDGAPVPPDTTVRSYHRAGLTYRSMPLSRGDKQFLGYTVTESYPPGNLTVAALAPGYAAVFSEPRALFVENGDQEIELVLTRGFTTKLRMVDENGEALPNARIRLWVGLSDHDHWMCLAHRDFTTDEDGTAVVDRVSGRKYRFEARCRGFQHATRRLTPSADDTTDWKMLAARPTEVRVVDSAGAPVPGAKLVIASRRSAQGPAQYGDPVGDPRDWSGDAWRLFGETNNDGRTVLDELRDGSEYWFGVCADGFGLGVIEGVRGGEETQTVTLTEPLRITGKVTGALERLTTQKRNGKTTRVFWYDNGFRHDLNNFSSLMATVDEDGWFELPDLLSGRVELMLPGHTWRLNVQDSMTDLELQVDEEEDSPDALRETREVIIRLTGTEPGAPARGNMSVNGQSLGCFRPGERPIINNEVRVHVPVSARLLLEPRDVVGYTFETKWGLEIVAGEGPQIIELATRPAGAVHGRVLRPDGSAADNAYVRAFAVGLPDGSDTKLPESYGRNSATFFRCLPLGGRYRLVAREFDESAGYWAVSDEFIVTKSHPIEELELRLCRGRTVTVRVLDRKGDPMVGVSVGLSWGFSAHHHVNGFAAVTRTTDSDGIVRFENTAPDDVTSVFGLTGTGRITLLDGRFGWHGQLVEPPAGASVDYEIRQPKRMPAMAQPPAPSADRSERFSFRPILSRLGIEGM